RSCDGRPLAAAGVNLKSVRASGRLANAAASRGSPLAGVKEEIGSKLTATPAGFFLPWSGLLAASAGDSTSPAAASAATSLAPFEARTLSTPLTPCSRVDIASRTSRFHERIRFG